MAEEIKKEEKAGKGKFFITMILSLVLLGGGVFAGVYYMKTHAAAAGTVATGCFGSSARYARQSAMPYMAKSAKRPRAVTNTAQLSGRPKSRSRYASSDPLPSVRGASRIRNRSHGGVIASRLRASAKNANAASTATGKTCERSRTRSATQPQAAGTRPALLSDSSTTSAASRSAW